MTAWNLCLQSRQGRKVISLDSKASTKELYESTAKEFGCGIERLKAGFPPKPIPSDSTPIGNFVSNQERIQVEFAASSSSSPKKGKKTAKKNTTTTTNTTSTSNNDTSRRSKRAASKAATESMPALIKAQEEYMKQNAPPAGKKRARSTNNGIHGIFPNRTKSSPKSKRLPASAGAGRRLNDGATVANPSRRKRQSDPNSGGDMSTALMGAIHDKGQMGIILRRGMKNAVLSSYETTKSFSRLAAIQAKSYTLNNTGSLLQISYKGSVDKTKVEEQVDCIPKDVLQAVLEGIHASNQEALRPENLSKLSPRVLWSCVHYFPNLDSLAAIYRALLPDLDWGFLRRRAEQLSEKALENKRQLGEEDDDDDDDLDLERASNVVAAVEHAMEHLQDFASVERKAKQAQAAEARLRRLQNTYSTWKLVTPSEPDRDELRECIEVALPEKASAAQITKWISQLMAHKIHNWRELALASSKVDILADKLNVPVSNIRLWIDKAQSESVPEIMVKICDNNVQAVELLAEHAKSGTPKDLSGWRSIPDMLLEQLPQTQRMDLGTLSTWCDRAHALLQEYEWLNWYATPV